MTAGYELVPQNQESIVALDGGFSTSGPQVEVASAVLVPSLGESMRITVTTPARSDVIVEIYDVTGRKVDTLYDEMPAGIESSGGSAANSMAGFASLGGKGAFIGKIRDDQFGTVFRHDMRAMGCAFDTAAAADGPGTGRCLVLVTMRRSAL